MNAIKKKKSPLLAKIKFKPTFFPVLWQFAFPLPLFGEAGGRGTRLCAAWLFKQSSDKRNRFRQRQSPVYQKGF